MCSIYDIYVLSAPEPFSFLCQEATAAMTGAAVAVATPIEPDESLVQALFKRGVSINRARRACAATRNASREVALAWCVEHAGDPAMDAPFVPFLSRRNQNARTATTTASSKRWSSEGEVRVTGCDVFGGGKDRDFGQQRWDDASTVAAAAAASARAHRGVAAAALEVYVRARLSAMGHDGGLRGSGGNSAAESEELVAVLKSFKHRKSLGEAEDRARALLPAGVDLGKFARDLGYRQVR